MLQVRQFIVLLSHYLSYLHLIIPIMIAGCVTQSAHQFNQPYNEKTHRFIRVETCVNRTAYRGSRDIETKATHSFIKKINESELFDVSVNAELILVCNIERFKEGSAIKRWILPGWGATQVEISAVLIQEDNQKIITILRSQSSVRGGGLYTISADSYITAVAIDDIVKQLENWALEKQNDN